MAHRRAKLTVFGRRLIVARVEAGWPVAHVAEQLGISRPTAYKWVRRFRAEGDPGLEDRSSRPRRSPGRLPESVASEILAARVAWRYGPHRLGYLLGQPRSTVYAVLRRARMSRLRDRPYTSNEERAAALPVFVDFYNRRRQQRVWESHLGAGHVAKRGLVGVRHEGDLGLGDHERR